MKIKKDINKNPFLTARKIKDKNPRLMHDLSLRTIRWVLLKDLKLPSRVAAKKPMLTQRMKIQRLAFALKYKNWTSTDWNQVIFSDESLFRTTQTTKGRRVRRRQNTDRYEDKLTTKTVKFPPSLMVWGFFSSRGKGDICILPRNETVNAKKYLELLKLHLVKSLKSHKCKYFQHDKASCHQAKLITKFLQEQKIEVIKWPGNSPDLAPIENCWGYMEKQMEDKDMVGGGQAVCRAVGVGVHHMAAKVPDKVEFRREAEEAIVSLMGAMPKDLFSSTMRWFIR